MIHRRTILAGAGASLLLPLTAAAAVGLDDLILARSNAARRAAGLDPFHNAGPLRRAAALHAQAMARAGKLTHTVGRSTPVTRARAQGYRYRHLAENIGYRSTGRLDAEGMARYFVDAWLGSAAHRRNLLNPRLRDAGIGTASDGHYIWAVQLLATRR